MAPSLRHRKDKSGFAPGALVHVGEQKVLETTITLTDYNHDGYFIERKITDLVMLQGTYEDKNLTWVDIIGLHDVEKIAEIGRIYDIHPLLLEDILNTEQRPKLEQYESYTYIILKDLGWTADEDDELGVEQISIVLGKGFVLTFQERSKDVFYTLRQRLRDDKRRIRQQEVDYLAYAILDTIIDRYFFILEEVSDDIEYLEEAMIANPIPETLNELYDLKRQLLYLRRSVWPLREVLSRLQRGESDLFHDSTLIYLRDVYEHVIQVIDTVETHRELVAGLVEVYLSSVSQKTNEVMRLLTVISTVFIPLTFITSLYGMNFKYMPELQTSWGYFGVWGIMLLITVCLLIYFKRKEWL